MQNQLLSRANYRSSAGRTIFRPNIADVLCFAELTSIANGRIDLEAPRAATCCGPCCGATYDPATCGYSRHASLTGSRER
jgi:hypothetical protein